MESRCFARTKAGEQCKSPASVMVATDRFGMVPLCSKHHAMMYEGQPVELIVEVKSDG